MELISGIQGLLIVLIILWHEKCQIIVWLVFMKLEGKSGIYQMEVPFLLKKLDSLNEEGRAIQKEKQRVDDELANTKLQCELTTQVSLLSTCNALGHLITEETNRRDSIRRRRWGDILRNWSRVDVNDMCMTSRKKRAVIQNLQQRVQELKQQKKQMIQSIEEEAYRLLLCFIKWGNPPRNCWRQDSISPISTTHKRANRKGGSITTATVGSA